MSAAHARRDEPQCYALGALDWGRSPHVPLLAGLDAKTLQVDPARGSSTSVARLPGGWRTSYDAAEATLELFVLAGDVALAGDRVGAGGYVSVPRGSGTVELRSAGGAQAIVYWMPASALVHGAAPRVTRVQREPWQVQKMEAMPHGPMSKSLRLPDNVEGAVHGGPGGILRLVMLPPGWADASEHVHWVWEGLVFLAGDLAMPDRGILAQGSYLGNPAGYVHGPMASQTGALILVQTDEPVSQPAWRKPGAQAFANGYRELRSWLEPSQHRAWEGLPDYERAGAALAWSDLPLGAGALLEGQPAEPPIPYHRLTPPR